MNHLSGVPDSWAHGGNTASGCEAGLSGGIGPPWRSGTANPVQAHLSVGANIGRAMSSYYPLKLTLNIGQAALGSNFRTSRSFL